MKKLNNCGQKMSNGLSKFVPSKQDWRKLSLVHRTQRVDEHNFGYVDIK